MSQAQQSLQVAINEFRFVVDKCGTPVAADDLETKIDLCRNGVYLLARGSVHLCHPLENFGKLLPTAPPVVQAAAALQAHIRPGG